MMERRTIEAGDLTILQILDMSWAQDQLEPEYLAVVRVFVSGRAKPKIKKR
jgi:hypothetical protein